MCPSRTPSRRIQQYSYRAVRVTVDKKSLAVGLPNCVTRAAIAIGLEIYSPCNIVIIATRLDSLVVFLREPAGSAMSAVETVLQINLRFTDHIVSSDQVPVEDLYGQQRVLRKCCLYLETPKMQIGLQFRKSVRRKV